MPGEYEGGILTALANQPQAQVAMALAFIGLRPAEIIGLQWQDIGHDQIRIERSMWRGTIAPCKTKRSRRVVALGLGVAALLARYQAATTSVSGYVLENSIGKPLSTSGLAKLAREIIRPALKAHGYDWKTMYAGRHGAVTEMNRHTNGNVQVAAAHFGHSPRLRQSTTCTAYRKRRDAQAKHSIPRSQAV